MSTVVAYIDPSSLDCFMGGESQCNNGEMKTLRNNPKIFDKGYCLAGAVGSFRFIQLVEFLDEPSRQFNGLRMQDPYRWVIQVFVDGKLKPYLKEKEYTMHEDEKILMILGEKIFIIESDFQVGEIRENYFAIGSGAKYALGALFSMGQMFTKDSVDIHRIIYSCLGAAKFYDKGSGGDSIIITKNFSDEQKTHQLSQDSSI